MFLEGDGKLFRLTWTSGQGDRRRALPAGDYKIRGYRIRKTDDRGIDWHISVASPGFRQLTVKPGHEVKIDIKPTISIKPQVRRKGGEMTVFTPVLGERDSGLSIYRKGKRIRFHYRLTNAGGETIATGTMRYG